MSSLNRKHTAGLTGVAALLGADWLPATSLTEGS